MIVNSMFLLLLLHQVTEGLPISSRYSPIENSLIVDGAEKKHHTSERSGLDAAIRTVTPKPPMVELNDIFISVKTTRANHGNRLDVIGKTWLQLAKAQTWIFTDGADPSLELDFGDHLIDTKCPTGHSRHALCCKTAAELNTFLRQQHKKWFCHFDDDNYVNVPQLVRLLNEYHPSQDWYLGKPSVAAPLEVSFNFKCDEIGDRGHRKFWFATGGAGFCISRPLAEKMTHSIEVNNFKVISDCIGFPDDVTVGFIIEYMLQVPLTVVDQFHSHFEAMNQIPTNALANQVSFSYGQSHDEAWNVLNLNRFSVNADPTRFLSLNCHLFPLASNCSLTNR